MTSSQIDSEGLVGGQEGSILEGSMMTMVGKYAWAGGHMCIILEEEEIYCVGDNDHGQLGGISEGYVMLPENVSIVNEITSGGSNYPGIHNCAIVNNGEVICWGTLGTTDYGQWHEPTPVFVEIPVDRYAVAIESFDRYVLAILDNHSVYCLDLTDDGCEPNWADFFHSVNDMGVSVLSLGTGYGGSRCAALENMTIYCHGFDDDGLPTWIDAGSGYSNPVDWSNSSVYMSVGTSEVCYFSTGYAYPPFLFAQPESTQPGIQGSLTCWGEYIYYYDSSAISTSMGRNHACHVLYNGSISCIVSDIGSPVGQNGRFLVELPDNYLATSIYSDLAGTCAIGSNNTTENQMFCWGHYPNATSGDSSIPRHIPLPSGVKQVSRDTDGDGVINFLDLCNFGDTDWISSYSTDYDADGCRDSTEDYDDDNDNHPDNVDMCPISDLTFNGSDSFQMNFQDQWSHYYAWYDTDDDGCHNTEDLDDDDDGIADSIDIFPFNQNESTDTDGDGIGDNSDLDNDNDGWSDDFESSCGSDPLDANSTFADTDSDFICDLMDDDDDGDGVNDADDACPREGMIGWSPNTENDIDDDGCHNDEDYDDDGDGVNDNDDAFPDDPSKTNDDEVVEDSESEGHEDGGNGGASDATGGLPGVGSLMTMTTILFGAILFSRNIDKENKGTY